VSKESEADRLKRMNKALEDQRKKNQSDKAKKKRADRESFWRRMSGGGS
jgi:hypothetical protein